MEVIDNIIHSGSFLLLGAVIFIDIVTGKVKAFKNETYLSHGGVVGVTKHLIVLMLVMLVMVVSEISGFNELSLAFIAFYIFDYIISILENLERIGVPFPDKLRKHILTMGSDYDKYVNEHLKRMSGDDNEL